MAARNFPRVVAQQVPAAEERGFRGRERLDPESPASHFPEPEMPTLGRGSRSRETGTQSQDTHPPEKPAQIGPLVPERSPIEKFKNGRRTVKADLWTAVSWEPAVVERRARSPRTRHNLPFAMVGSAKNGGDSM